MSETVPRNSKLHQQKKAQHTHPSDFPPVLSMQMLSLAKPNFQEPGFRSSEFSGQASGLLVQCIGRSRYLKNIPQKNDHFLKSRSSQICTLVCRLLLTSLSFKMYYKNKTLAHIPSQTTVVTDHKVPLFWVLQIRLILMARFFVVHI